MLAVLLSLAAAATYGGSDFAAGMAARRTGVLVMTLLAADRPFRSASAGPRPAARTGGPDAGLAAGAGFALLFIGLDRPR